MPAEFDTDTLFDVGSIVLEEATFVCALPAKWTRDRPAEGEAIEALLTFRGPRRGVLRMTTTRDCCIMLAANLLGIEPSEGDAKRASTEVLGELLNMIAGNLVGTVFGDKTTCAIGIPKVSVCTATPKHTPTSAVALAVDDHRIDLEAYVES